MKVYNLEGQSGRVVANQFVIEDGKKIVFQSYDSAIVKCEYNETGCDVMIGRDWDYSRTTTKYLKVFLINEIGMTNDEVETIKKQLRKGNTDYFIIDRFVIYYCEDIQ